MSTGKWAFTTASKSRGDKELLILLAILYVAQLPRIDFRVCHSSHFKGFFFHLYGLSFTRCGFLISTSACFFFLDSNPFIWLKKQKKQRQVSGVIWDSFQDIMVYLNFLLLIEWPPGQRRPAGCRSSCPSQIVKTPEVVFYENAEGSDCFKLKK